MSYQQETPVAPPPPPHSKEAEQSVIARMLLRPRAIEQVAGDLLVPDHFYIAANRILFERIVEHHIAGDPVDPLSIGTAVAHRLEKIWGCSREEAIARVQGMIATDISGSPTAHALIVRRKADERALFQLCWSAEAALQEGEKTPEEIAGLLTENAMKVATEGLRQHETISYGDLGRAFIRRQRALMAAVAEGYELGVHFGLRAIDDFLKGLKPTELFIVAGEAGVGKSAVTWVLAKMFAKRQHAQQERREQAERLHWKDELTDEEREAYIAEHMDGHPEEEKAIVRIDGPKVPDQRMGTLILSMEMGQEPSEDRLAQELSGVDGGRLREGTLEEDSLVKITRAWSSEKDLPLWFNFTSHFRASQLRAYISDEIRKHHIGLVIIDHFRYFDLDKRPEDKNKEDEEKARFLKTHIAEDLNVAVIVLAHTTKDIDTRDKRPQLKHLAGSGQIGAHADFVAFVHRPIKHASEKAIASGTVKATEAELIFRKNRHNLEGISPIYLDLSIMRLCDPEDAAEQTEAIPF